MSFAKVHSGQIYLLSGQIVDVEVDLSRGLHSFSVIGLPDKAVEESRDRISAAIKNSGFESPKHKNQKVVISLSPAHLKKQGSVFDLAMALGYLLASGDISFDPTGKLFLGELSLDGELRNASGVLPIVIEARKRGFKEIFLPKSYVEEAALVSDVAIYGAEKLSEVVEHLSKKKFSENTRKIIPLISSNNLMGISSDKKNSGEAEKSTKDEEKDSVDIEEIKGQEFAKRGLAIAAAGGHNVLMYGPPGTGKTMLAKAFRKLLPSLSREQVLEVSSIHSIAGCLSKIITEPPFRAPHHSSSHTSLIGGGSIPRPGEITLAHRGVLFLDEFPEFERRVIETLRQPLEEKSITISRAKNSVNFPANVILIATMNPCPCGHFGNAMKRCSCNSKDISRYRKKVSGPIADRIDIWIEVGPIEYEKLKPSNKILHTSDAFETKKLKQKIAHAREVRTNRFKKFNQCEIYKTTSDIQAKDLPRYAPLSETAETTLMNAAKSLALSMRAYHRVWKLARTIADLDNSGIQKGNPKYGEEIQEVHVLEALQYRPPKEPDEI